MTSWHGGEDWISEEEPHMDACWSTEILEGVRMQVRVQEKRENIMCGRVEVQD